MWTIGIVGLGLMGGSMAKALHGFRGGVIYGIDTNAETLHKAQSDGVIDKAFSVPNRALSDCDLLILCLYPAANLAFLREAVPFLKDGVVVTDVCGVKEKLTQEIEAILPPHAAYLGGHPMAGRELSGYDASVADLFLNCNYLLTPTAHSKPEALALMHEVADYIGSRCVIETTPQEHDEMIAYTSQLMHVVAVALCDNAHLSKAAGYSAGSLRDCTRVAVINEELWSELFLENKEPLARLIDEMTASLQVMKQAMLADDRDALKQTMRRATAAKLKWLNS